MKKRFLSKGSSRPTHHAGSGDCDPVDTSRPVCDISTHFLEAPPSKKLATSCDVVLTLKTVGCRTVAFFPENGPCDSKIGIFFELSYEKFAIVRFKGKVRIQVSDHFILKVLDSIKAGVERMNLPGEASIPVYGQINQFHPVVLREVLAHNPCRGVRRPIIHDHPLGWQDGLAHHRLNRFFDKPFLISSRGDEDVPYVT